ncbi:MAG: hypothetical protein HY075_03850 [Deltaproteobacteria bacterium]|nr:hypothetical protein [Deltaproteobacteria bacterium]
MSHAFEDGRASYVDQYGNSHVSSQLEPSVPSLGNLASGHHAVDESNRLATVTYTFRDGRASYTDEYGNGHVSRALSAETGHASADADVKRDATIIDASNRIGRVAYVFEDDRVRYADAYGNNHVDGSKSLSVEVETNPKYDKKLAYATEGYSVGTPKRFFKDGRIELVMLGGGGRVETRLYSQVNELSGYAAGTLVAESTGLSGRVTMVFENGTVAAEYKYSYEDKELAATIAAKIFGFDPARIAQDEATWIHLLEQRVLAEKNKWYRFNGPRGLLTAVESGLPALKAQLAARLAREPRLVRSDENRSAVLAILGAATPTPAPGAGEPTKPVTKPGRRGD